MLVLIYLGILRKIYFYEWIQQFTFHWGFIFLQCNFLFPNIDPDYCKLNTWNFTVIQEQFLIEHFLWNILIKYYNRIYSWNIFTKYNLFRNVCNIKVQKCGEAVSKISTFMRLVTWMTTCLIQNVWRFCFKSLRNFKYFG